MGSLSSNIPVPHTTFTADEQDAFESDFESTDEEAAQEDVDAAAEKMIREEEKKTRKVRLRLSPRRRVLNVTIPCL